MRICTDLAPIPVFRETKNKTVYPGLAGKKNRDVASHHFAASQAWKAQNRVSAAQRAKKRRWMSEILGQNGGWEKNETLDGADSGADCWVGYGAGV